MPEAVETHASAPSSNASFSSNTAFVGFPNLVYLYPASSPEKILPPCSVESNINVDV